MTARRINLLPPAEQQANRVHEASYQLRDFGIWLLISLGLLAFFLAAARFYLQEQLQTSAEELAQQTNFLNNAETASLKKDIESLNTDLANFQTLSADQRRYSAVFMELARLLPSDMTIDRLSFDTADNKAELAGRGGSRSSVLKFRENLVSSQYFKNVNFPLANLERAAGASWSYRFYVDPERLKL